jgi:hypothetical protein
VIRGKALVNRVLDGNIRAPWGELGKNGGNLSVNGASDGCDASSSIEGAARRARELSASGLTQSWIARIRNPGLLLGCHQGVPPGLSGLVAHRVGADLLRRHIKVRAEPRDVGTGRHCFVLTNGVARSSIQEPAHRDDRAFRHPVVEGGPGRVIQLECGGLVGWPRGHRMLGSEGQGFSPAFPSRLLSVFKKAPRHGVLLSVAGRRHQTFRGTLPRSRAHTTLTLARENLTDKGSAPFFLWSRINSIS